MSSYWYKKVVYACPFCDYRHIKRVRVYGKKPRDECERVETVIVFDFCEGEKK